VSLPESERQTNIQRREVRERADGVAIQSIENVPMHKAAGQPNWPPDSQLEINSDCGGAMRSTLVLSASVRSGSLEPSNQGTHGSVNPRDIDWSKRKTHGHCISVVATANLVQRVTRACPKTTHHFIGGCEMHATAESNSAIYLADRVTG
jgi:hypothetical protein